MSDLYWNKLQFTVVWSPALKQDISKLEVEGMQKRFTKRLV